MLALFGVLLDALLIFISAILVVTSVIGMILGLVWVKDSVEVLHRFWRMPYGEEIAQQARAWSVRQGEAEWIIEDRYNTALKNPRSLGYRYARNALLALTLIPCANYIWFMFILGPLF